MILAQTQEMRLTLLPRKRHVESHLYIYIFILPAESNLKSTADVVFQVICLFVILGSKSLKNFCVTWVVVCIALWVILPSQMLLRNREQRKVVERSDVSSYLLPFRKNPTQKPLEKLVCSAL